MQGQSNVEKFLSALINDDPTSVADIIPRTNVEHFLKECVDKVDCGHCPAPLSRMDILLEQLRDKLINGGGGSGKTEQEKSVTITTNGTTEVLPDENKTLSKVTVNTSVVAESKLPQFIDGTLTELTAADFAGATKIKEFAFYNMSSLKSVTLPDSVTSIERQAFSDTNIEYIDASNVINIGDYAFYDCKNLKEVVLRSTVSAFGGYLFWNCTSLTSINLPTNIEEIIQYTFNGCANLTSLEIPASVKKIWGQALRIGSQTNKATITMLSTTPPQYTNGAINENTINQIIVPAGCGDAYKAATNWAALADYIVEATE